MPKEAKEVEVVPHRTPILHDEVPTPAQDGLPKQDPYAGLEPARAKFAAYLERLTAPLREKGTIPNSPQAKSAALTAQFGAVGWDQGLRNNMPEMLTIVLGVPVLPGDGANRSDTFHKGEMRVPLTQHNSHNYPLNLPVIIEARGNGCVAGYTADGRRGNDFYIASPNSRPATPAEIVEFARVCNIEKLTTAFGIIII